MSGRRRHHSFAFVVIAVLAVVPVFGTPAASDALFVGHATTTGKLVAVPVYVRDASGTPLGVDQSRRISVIQFKIIFSEPAVISGCASQGIPQCAVTFVPQGVLADKTLTLSQIRDARSITVRVTYPSTTDSIKFEKDADAPGDPIGRLELTLDPERKDVSHLLLDLDSEVTRLEENRFGETITETDANGTLQLFSGSVGIGSSCEVPPPSVNMGWSGKFSGCTQVLGGCHLEETIFFFLDTELRACEKAYWTFDDGTIKTSESPDHQFLTLGQHRVGLILVNQHGTFRSEGKVDVSVLCSPPPQTGPAIAWTGSQACEPFCKTEEKITFGVSDYDFLGCEQFLWAFGDGTTSTAKNPTKTYSKEGSYDVQLTVLTARGQSEYKAKLSVSNLLPGPSCGQMIPGVNVSISYTGPTSGCSTTPGSVSCVVNETVAFNANSVSSLGYDFSCATHTFQWSFGDGSTANGRSPTHSYATAGTYNVMLTINNGQQTVTLPKTVSVSGGSANVCPDMVPNNNVFIAYTGPASGCTQSAGKCSSKEAIAFNAVTFGYNFDCAGHTFRWSFGDGSTSTAKSPVHSYATAGTYNVTLTITNSRQTVSMIRAVDVGGAGRRRSTRH